MGFLDGLGAGLDAWILWLGSMPGLDAGLDGWVFWIGSLAAFDAWVGCLGSIPVFFWMGSLATLMATIYIYIYGLWLGSISGHGS